MALGPKQMGEAILKNIQKKTGKTVIEWVDILKASEISEKKEAIALLKSKHGLGHFQAKMIFDSMNENHDYKEENEIIEALFSNRKSRKLYEVVAQHIRSLGKDVRQQPCKTYIPFYRKNQFSILAPKGDDLILGLNYPESEVQIDEMEPCRLGSKRINCQLVLSNENLLYEDVKNAILIAYSNS